MSYTYDVFETPLGSLVGVFNEEALCRLAFAQDGVSSCLAKLKENYGENLVRKQTSLSEALRNELTLYFQGKLKVFQTPVKAEGTAFQQKAWEALKKIPYGAVASYKEQAINLGNPKASRAVGRANGLNPVPILIPCHRVINSGGQLGGYAGGLSTKSQLLELEKAVG